jgi:hypothetical protein
MSRRGGASPTNRSSDSTQQGGHGSPNAKKGSEPQHQHCRHLHLWRKHDLSQRGTARKPDTPAITGKGTPAEHDEGNRYEEEGNKQRTSLHLHTD